MANGGPVTPIMAAFSIRTGAYKKYLPEVSLPGLEAMHMVTVKFDIDLTWRQNFINVFGLELDPDFYVVKRSQSPQRNYLLTDMVNEIFLEYKKHTQNAFSICVVKTSGGRAKNDMATAGIRNVRLGHGSFAASPQNKTTKRKKSQESGNASKVRKMNVEPQPPQNSNRLSIDIENAIYKDTIVQCYARKFTNGQILRCKHALDKVQENKEMMKLTMSSPLLITFLRELFEV